MIWGRITKEVAPPKQGVAESLNDFYDVRVPGIYSLVGLVDIKEWGSDPDDTVIDVAVRNGAAYIMQWVTGRGVILKKLTATYTYIYNLASFPWVSIFGSRTPYGTMEVLDDDIIVFGDIYIDLDKLLLFLMREQLTIDVPFKLLGHVANYSSVKRINSMAWVRMRTNRRMRREYELYQRSSFLNCLSCEDRKRIFEAIGGHAEMESIACEEEDLGRITAYRHSSTAECGKVANANLKSLKAMDGQSVQPFGEDKDIAKCIDAFRRLATNLNASHIDSEALSTFKNVGKFCDEDMVVVLPDYIVAEQKARHINERFLEDYASGDVDYEKFFADVADVSKDVARVLVTLAKDPYDNAKAIGTLFTDQYLWGAFYIHLHEERYRQERFVAGKWDRFNPYRDLAFIDMEQFLLQVVVEMSKAQRIQAKPFKLRRVKLTSNKLFAKSAEFVSLGPAGCIMVKRLELEERYPVHAVCETEVRGSHIYLWTWTDMAAERNKHNNYMVDVAYWPECKIVVYRVDPGTGKGTAVAETDAPPRWNMLPSRKMAFATDRKKAVFREYYLKSEHEIGFVDIERPLPIGMQSLLGGSMATFAQANINNVVWEQGARYNHAVSPAFPDHLLGKRDLTPSDANIFFGRPPIAPTFI